jgi:ribosomal protein S18 acetylase RimI-like enzyme
MTPSVEPLKVDGPLFEGAIDVYSAAFALPPYSDPDRGEEIRSRIRDVHQDRPGFRAFCATLPNRQVVGMIYGYHGSPGQWWHDTVVRELDRDAAARWLGDSYELVEVAVDPAYQGRGIGEAMIHRLLEGVREATCVLSTRMDSRAHILYRRLGFQVITEMSFSPKGAPFYVMGKDLRLLPPGFSRPD